MTVPRVVPRSLTTALLVVVAACSGGDDATPTTPPVQPPATTTTTVAEPVPLTDQYFAVLAGRQPVDAQVVSQVAAPGSAAAFYLDHQLAARAVIGDQTPAELASDGDDGAATSDPATSAGVVRICETGESTSPGCVSYDAVVVEPGTGRVTSFSIDGEQLTGRVVGGGLAVEVESVVARARSAYRSNAGDLTVVLEITNDSDVDVDIFAFASVYQPPGVGGGLEAAGVFGSPEIGAGTTADLVVVFPDAELGGRLQLSGLRADGLDIATDVDVGAGAG